MVERACGLKQPREAGLCLWFMEFCVVSVWRFLMEHNTHVLVFQSKPGEDRNISGCCT